MLAAAFLAIKNLNSLNNTTPPNPYLNAITFLAIKIFMCKAPQLQFRAKTSGSKLPSFWIPIYRKIFAMMGKLSAPCWTSYLPRIWKHSMRPSWNEMKATKRCEQKGNRKKINTCLVLETPKNRATHILTFKDRRKEKEQLKASGTKFIIKKR